MLYYLQGYVNVILLNIVVGYKPDTELSMSLFLKSYFSSCLKIKMHIAEISCIHC